MKSKGNSKRKISKEAETLEPLPLKVISLEDLRVSFPENEKQRNENDYIRGSWGEYPLKQINGASVPHFNNVEEWLNACKAIGGENNELFCICESCGGVWGGVYPTICANCDNWDIEAFKEITGQMRDSLERGVSLKQVMTYSYS